MEIKQHLLREQKIDLTLRAVRVDAVPYSKNKLEVQLLFVDPKDLAEAIFEGLYRDEIKKLIKRLRKLTGDKNL